VLVLREGTRVGPVNVARELVEHNHEREIGFRGDAPRLELARGRCLERDPETFAHERIEGRVLAEPLGTRLAAPLERAEPEIENLYGQRRCSQRFTSTETCARDSMPSSRSRYSEGLRGSWATTLTTTA
jgi:hypothetical protein